MSYPATYKELEVWIRYASARLGKNLKDAQVEMYVEEMYPWGLTADELIRLERVIRRRSEGMWPNCMQLSDYAKRVAHRPETEPVFELIEGHDGRIKARPTQMRVLSVPDEETLARWRDEAIPMSEAKEIWDEAFRQKALEKAVISGVEVTPANLPDLGSEKKSLTGVTTPEESGGDATRSDYDPGDENSDTSFNFSGIEVEFSDEPEEPEEPETSQFDDL